MGDVPKCPFTYFPKVIKQACGRTPLDLINETAIEHIKYRLKHSDKSIKEIAEEFNFPNQSFFGKYVKGQRFIFHNRGLLLIVQISNK